MTGVTESMFKATRKKYTRLLFELHQMLFDNPEDYKTAIRLLLKNHGFDAVRKEVFQQHSDHRNEST